MQLILRKFLLSLVLLSFCSVAAAYTQKPESDIRYRTIVYFFAGTENFEETELARHLTDFEKVDALPESASKPVYTTQIIQDFEDSYPVPDSDYLSYFGRGITPEQSDNIQASNLALIVEFAYPTSHSFKGLKTTSQAVYQFTQTTSGLIWDSETRELFAPEYWKATRIDSWDDMLPNIDQHTVIHVYNSDNGVRAITLGMYKFGLPDILVNNFTWANNRSVGNLINLTAQHLVEGHMPNEDDILKLDINKLADSTFKTKMVAGLKDNATSKADIFIGVGEWEEGDPDNDILELLFDRGEGKSNSERQEFLLTQMFGWEDDITHVDHNAAITEASNRAKAKLDGLRSDFQEGLKPGSYLMLKAPFATPEGGSEWMWVEVTAWTDSNIQGLLSNEPYYIPDLKLGSEVELNQADVFDYLLRNADGTSEGNETGELIRKYQK